MGTVAAGAGVIGGTGAFTSVTAERTVSVQTTGDDAAALQLIPAGSNDSSGATANAADYVNDSGDTIQIDLTGTNNGASGLNQNAKTVLENLVSVLNNGTQAVTGLTLTMSTTASNVTADDTFKFTASEKVQGGSDLTGIPNGEDILSSQHLNTNIGAGSGSVDFGLIVDLINGGNNSNALPSSGSYTLTISATTQ
jgi:hypothetical protein